MSLVSRLASLFSRPVAIEQEKPDDFVAVGYPKTGNTWARVMLGRYLQIAYGLPFMPLFDGGEKADLLNAGYSGPRGVFTHAPLTFDGQVAMDLTYDNVVAPFTHKVVVLLVRHPLDALVSAYMQAVHRTAIPYRGTLPEFVADPVHGLDVLLKFYQLWAAHRSKPRGLWLWRYEDVRRSPVDHLKSLIEFLGARLESSAIADAIEYSSLDSMRAMERSTDTPVYRSSGLPIFATGDVNNPDAHHVRKGEIGGYKQYFDEETRSRLEKRISHEMPRWYGY